MRENYFSYILKKCISSDREKVLTHYSMWESYYNIVEDALLLGEVNNLLGEVGIATNYSYNEDFRIVYERCKKAINEVVGLSRKKTIDYDQLFDILIEVCWIEASICMYHKSRQIELIKTQKQKDDYLDYFLKNLYDHVFDDQIEISCMNEALREIESHPYFPSRSGHKYTKTSEYIREYRQSVITKRDIEDQRDRYRRNCEKHISLYYGLLVTNTLAKHIWRRGR